jgi:hypothetical protein
VCSLPPGILFPKTLKMGQTSDPETSVMHQKVTPANNPEDFKQHYDRGGSLQLHIRVYYQCTLRNIAEERRSHLHRVGSLKSHLLHVVILTYICECPCRVFEVKACFPRFPSDLLSEQVHHRRVLPFTRAIEPHSFPVSI